LSFFVTFHKDGSLKAGQSLVTSHNRGLAPVIPVNGYSKISRYKKVFNYS